jgi:hypothetical protein
MEIISRNQQSMACPAASGMCKKHTWPIIGAGPRMLGSNMPGGPGRGAPCMPGTLRNCCDGGMARGYPCKLQDSPVRNLMQTRDSPGQFEFTGFARAVRGNSESGYGDTSAGGISCVNDKARIPRASAAALAAAGPAQSVAAAVAGAAAWGALPQAVPTIQCHMFKISATETTIAGEPGPFFGIFGSRCRNTICDSSMQKIPTPTSYRTCLGDDGLAAKYSRKDERRISP